MNPNFIKHIDEYFKNLIELFGFSKRNEIMEDQTYSVEFDSNSFTFKIELYRHEFYVTLYNIKYPDNEISLFNLIDYLHPNSINGQKANYFEEEKNIDVRYSKQLKYLSEVIYNNHNELSDFLNSNDFELKVRDLEEFIIGKYPNLFKRI